MRKEPARGRLHDPRFTMQTIQAPERVQPCNLVHPLQALQGWRWKSHQPGGTRAGQLGQLRLLCGAVGTIAATLRGNWDNCGYSAGQLGQLRLLCGAIGTIAATLVACRLPQATMLNRGTVSTERRSLMGTHRQSWWFTKFNYCRLDIATLKPDTMSNNSSVIEFCRC